jgi:hypothetical protein
MVPEEDCRLAVAMPSGTVSLVASEPHCNWADAAEGGELRKVNELVQDLERSSSIGDPVPRCKDNVDRAALFTIVGRCEVKLGARAACSVYLLVDLGDQGWHVV